MSSYDAVHIQGQIKKINVNKADWEFVINGNLIIPKGPEEKFSLFLNLDTIKKLFTHNLLLKIKGVKLDESGMGMILLEDKGSSGHDNTLITGNKTIYILCTGLNPKGSNDHSSEAEKVKMISEVLKGKALFVGIPSDKTKTLSPEAFMIGKNVDLIIHYDD